MQQALIKETASDEKELKDERRHGIPDELVFTAQQKITLSCGKSQITLYPNGKVVLPVPALPVRKIFTFVSFMNFKASSNASVFIVSILQIWITKVTHK